MDLIPDVEAAGKRLQSYVRKTPLEYSPSLSIENGAQVFLKLETVQQTGSFKFRGAMHKLLTLSETERAAGVVAASSGNHGMATALAAQLLHAPAQVFVAADAAAMKVERIRRYGASVTVSGRNCVDAEHTARRMAAETGRVYISPYNDPAVIAGQGTIAIELLAQQEQIDAVFVSVGGGGLIVGIAGFLKEKGCRAEIIGCQPENSRVMHASVQAGHIVDIDEAPTLSDGTAGGIETGAITLPLVQRYVDRFVLVPEREIARAVRNLVEMENLVTEGAAALALAAFRGEAGRWAGKNVVVVLCGRNIAFDKLLAVLRVPPLQESPLEK